MKVLLCFFVLGWGQVFSSSYMTPSKEVAKKSTTVVDRQKSGFSEKQLADLWRTYHLVFTGFIKSDFKKAEAGAKEMIKVLDGLALGTEQKLLAKAKKGLDQIEEKASREINNKHFESVSKVLVSYLNQYKIDPKFQIFYCPMVRKRWIQDTKRYAKTHNAYDPGMLHCGGKVSNFK